MCFELCVHITNIYPYTFNLVTRNYSWLLTMHCIVKANTQGVGGCLPEAMKLSKGTCIRELLYTGVLQNTRFICHKRELYGERERISLNERVAGRAGWSTSMLTSPHQALGLCTMCMSHAKMQNLVYSDIWTMWQRILPLCSNIVNL